MLKHTSKRLPIKQNYKEKCLTLEHLIYNQRCSQYKSDTDSWDFRISKIWTLKRNSKWTFGCWTILIEFRRWFCSSINDVCRWTVQRRLLTRAPVGVVFSDVSVGRRGPCRGLSSRGMFYWGIICMASPRGVLTGESEDVILSCWRTRTSLRMCELAPLAVIVVFWKALVLSSLKTGRAYNSHRRRH